MLALYFTSFWSASLFVVSLLQKKSRPKFSDDGTRMSEKVSQALQRRPKQTVVSWLAKTGRIWVDILASLGSL